MIKTSTPADRKNVVGIINSLEKGGAERQMIYLLNNSVISELFLLENVIKYDISREKSQYVESLLPGEKVKSLIFKYFLVLFYCFDYSFKFRKKNR